MWSGALNDIPNNFVLCDGTNGTPDLRNKFIIGAGNNYSFGDLGGFANVTLAEHSHTVSGTTNSMNPSHTHGLGSVNLNSGTGTSRQSGSGGGSGTTSSVQVSHSHGLALSQTGVGETGIGKNLPPYYALAFIMQVA